jgi:mannitol/fructose-specific phosphotransferase system IIA component (Ntr-type)
MIRIRGTLLPDHILLNLNAQTRGEAVQQVSASVRSDARMADWQEFSRALRKYEGAGKLNLDHGLTLPHLRTSAVTKMIMAFGRLIQPLPEKEGPIQFVVLVGIPLAMDAEYLRLVGTLMRTFRNEKLRQKLLNAQNPADIIGILEKGETGRDPEE